MWKNVLKYTYFSSNLFRLGVAELFHCEKWTRQNEKVNSEVMVENIKDLKGQAGYVR